MSRDGLIHYQMYHSFKKDLRCIQEKAPQILNTQVSSHGDLSSSSDIIKLTD